MCDVQVLELQKQMAALSVYASPENQNKQGIINVLKNDNFYASFKSAIDKLVTVDNTCLMTAAQMDPKGLCDKHGKILTSTDINDIILIINKYKPIIAQLRGKLYNYLDYVNSTCDASDKEKITNIKKLISTIALTQVESDMMTSECSKYLPNGSQSSGSNNQSYSFNNLSIILIIVIIILVIICVVMYTSKQTNFISNK